MSVLVAGMTRSGLTLTMHMLAAGGHQVLGTYPGYEDYPVGQIPWFQVSTEAVKVVDVHRQLPPGNGWKVIHPRRNLGEQAKSVSKFIEAVCGVRAPVGQIRDSLERDYAALEPWLAQQDVLRIRFEELILEPHASAQLLADFVGGTMDVSAMAAAVAPRGPHCYPGLLELSMLPEVPMDDSTLPDPGHGSEPSEISEELGQPPYRPCPTCSDELMPDDYRNAWRDQQSEVICGRCREEWITGMENRLTDPEGGP